MTKHHSRLLQLIGSFLFICLTLIITPVTAQPLPQNFKIIIGVNTAFRPEGELVSANAVAWQRFGIAYRQRLILDMLNQMNIAPNNVKRFQTIPYMALEVDSAGLLALQTNPNVTEIREDRITRITTASANVVVNVQPAWNVGLNGSGYAVAILDTGVDFTHPSLTDKRLDNGNPEACFSTTYAPHMATTACPNGLNTQYGFGASMPKLPPQCRYGCDHGTHVAGIAAGNGVGKGGVHENFRGVAPGAMLIGVNVFSLFNDTSFCGSPSLTPCTASYDSDQLRGLEHIYNLRNTYNIASVNMSLGGGAYGSACDWDATTAYLNAVSNLKSARIAVIAASGNEGLTSQIGMPACLSNVISVGATTDADAVASFSNSAPILDLLAPGASITSTVPGGSYQTWNGTSMATPYVAGAWAIMRQMYPTASVDSILNQLKTYGVPVFDGRNGITRSRINIGNSIPTPGQIRFSSSSSSQSEGSSHSIPINLSLGNGLINLPSPFTIDLTYSGTAIRNFDYTAPNSITFSRSGGWLPNTNYPSEAVIVLQILNDDIIDPGRAIVITLNTPNGVPVTLDSPHIHTVTIINTNIQATGEINFQTNSSNVGEYGESGQTNQVLIPVIMTVINGTPNITGTVDFNIAYGGSAVQGVDYTAPTTITFSGTNFGAGTYMVRIPVTILARAGLQGTRQITMTLQEPPHIHVSLGTTYPNMTVNIIEGSQLRMTENELRHEMMTLLTTSNTITSVLPDFIAGSGINMVVILRDGTVGTVSISLTSEMGANRIALGAMTVNGAPAPSRFVDVVNYELPDLMTRAIENFLIARTGSSRRLDITQVTASELLFGYLP